MRNQINSLDRPTGSESPKVLQARKKMGALVMTASAVVGGGLAAYGTAQNRGVRELEPPTPVTVAHTLRQGETVWDVARPAADEQNVDIRDVVDDAIKASPDLADGTANVGDTVYVPATEAQIQDQEDGAVKHIG